MKDSTDKLIFLYEAFNKNRIIEAHIFNDVFTEFQDKFYGGKKYRNAMSNFKKWIKVASENKGHEIIVIPERGTELIHGIRNVWIVKYNKP